MGVLVERGISEHKWDWALTKYKIDMVDQIEEYKTQINDLKDRYNTIKESRDKHLSDIELLRRESLDSYRKGLFDGLEINKGNPLNGVEQNPVKTIDEHKEIIETNKDEIAQQRYSAEQMKEYLYGKDGDF